MYDDISFSGLLTIIISMHFHWNGKYDNLITALFESFKNLIHFLESDLATIGHILLYPGGE